MSLGFAMKLKRAIYLVFGLLSMTTHFCCLAQTPDGYYNSTNGLSGDSLKLALHGLIKDHVEFTYTSSSTDTWDILKETDKDTANPENVILFYSGWSVNAEQEYNNEQGWSREHVWAKSHGDFGTSKGAGTDVHHLRPCDISVNNARGNDDFDNGGSIYVDGSGTTECRTDNDSWEARDNVKGDVARMLFYMTVRYEGENGEPDLELVDAVNSFDLNENGKGYHGKLSALLEWHNSDPVDSFEINRNNVIYTYQGNRNPFIDHPEFVNSIWSITGVNLLNRNELQIYPNPANDFIFVELSNNEKVQGEIYSSSGKVEMEFEGTGQLKLNVEHLDSGLYFIHITSKNQIKKSKVVIVK